MRPGGRRGGHEWSAASSRKKGEEGGNRGEEKAPVPTTFCRPAHADLPTPAREKEQQLRDRRGRQKRNKEVSHRRTSVDLQDNRVFSKEDLLLSLLKTKTEEGERRGGTKTAGKRGKFSKYFSSSYCPSLAGINNVMYFGCAKVLRNLCFLLLQSKNILPPHETFVGKQRKVQTFFVERGKLPK